MDFIRVNRITFLSILKNFNIDKNRYANELLTNEIEILKSGHLYCNNSLYGYLNINFNDILKFVKHHKNYITYRIQIDKQTFIIKFFDKRCEIYKNNMNADNFIQSIPWLYEPFNEDYNISHAKRYVKALFRL